MPSITAARPSGSDGLAVESWGQGLMVGSLLVMIAVTVANMRRKVLLHKLIAAELVLAIGHGTFIFVRPPAYGWYLSVTAIGLNVSWSLHNLISWMKVRRFFTGWGSRVYLASLLAAQPYWVVEIYANFAFFNSDNLLFLKTRPLEPLFRDPWWIFTSCFLLHKIQRGYRCPLWQLVQASPRFGAMLFFMALSLVFTIVDTCAVAGAFHLELPLGVEPFWKLAFVFKCLGDMIILDDFKSALEQVRDRCFPRPGNLELQSGHAPAQNQEYSPLNEPIERPEPVHGSEASGWYRTSRWALTMSDGLRSQLRS